MPVDIAEAGIDPTDPERPQVVFTDREGTQHRFAFASFHDFNRFRFLSNQVANHLHRERERPKWADRAAAWVPPKRR